MVLWKSFNSHYGLFDAQPALHNTTRISYFHTTALFVLQTTIMQPNCYNAVKREKCGENQWLHFITHVPNSSTSITRSQFIIM